MSESKKFLLSSLSIKYPAYFCPISSDSEALAAGAKNIKEELFGLKGYRANYSQTVFFTVFVKNDEGAEAVAQVRALHFGIQVKDGNRYQENLSDATWLRFYGLIDAEGNDVACYVVQEDEDSYAEYNFLTILVDGNVDLSKLAPLRTSSEFKCLLASW